MLKKFHRLLILLLAIAILATGCIGPVKTSDSTNATGNAGLSEIGLNPGDVPEFNALLMELFTEEITGNTVNYHYSMEHPENYGISMDEVTLGDYKLSHMEDEYEETKETLARLHGFDYKTLSTDQQLIYDILDEALQSSVESYAYTLYASTFSPTLGVQAQLPITMSEYTFRAEQDVNDYLALLKDMKRYFSQLLDIEEEKSRQGLFMADFTADAVIAQCQDFIESPEENLLIEIFGEKLDNELPELTDDQKQSYIQKNHDIVINDVIPAYEEIILRLTKLKGTGTNMGGLSNYKNGRDYYACLVKNTTGSSRSVDEMITMVDAALQQDITLIALLYSKDPELFTKLSEAAPALSDPEKILTALQSDILGEFPAPVSTTFNVKSVHESIGENASPAFYMIPAIDATDSNTIYINSYYPRNDDLVTLFITLSHEGYPGHLYQNTYFNSTDPHPIRKVLDSLGYSEGWATYVEMMAYSWAVPDENVAQALRADRDFSLGLSTRIDIGVNYEGWTREDTLAYLDKFNLGDEDTANAIFEAVVAEPGNYLAYYIGYLEMQQLRQTAQKSLGDSFDPVTFHKFILDIGPAPFDIISDHMETWIHDYSHNQNKNQTQTSEAA